MTTDPKQLAAVLVQIEKLLRGLVDRTPEERQLDNAQLMEAAGVLIDQLEPINDQFDLALDDELEDEPV